MFWDSSTFFGAASGMYFLKLLLLELDLLCSAFNIIPFFVFGQMKLMLASGHQ